LWQVIGQCEALTPAPDVLEQNRTKGKARLRFCGSRAAEGGEAFTILLCEGLLASQLELYPALTKNAKQ